MLSNIPKSATLKNVRFKRRSLSNLKNLSFNKSQRSKEGISSANIASDNKSMSGIIEASWESSVTGQSFKDKVINLAKEESKEDAKSLRWNTKVDMEQVDEVIEDIKDFMQVIGCTILAEFNDEIHIRMESDGNIIKVAKSVFSQFGGDTPETDPEFSSPGYNIKVQSGSALEIRDKSNSIIKSKYEWTFVCWMSTCESLQHSDLHTSIRNSFTKGLLINADLKKLNIWC